MLAPLCFFCLSYRFGACSCISGDEEPEIKRQRVEEAPQPEANGEERSDIVRRYEPLSGNQAGPDLPAGEPLYREVPELLYCSSVTEEDAVGRRPLMRPLPFYFPELYGGYHGPPSLILSCMLNRGRFLHQTSTTAMERFL